MSYDGPARSFNWIHRSSSDVRRKTLVIGWPALACALPPTKSLASTAKRRWESGTTGLLNGPRDTRCPAARLRQAGATNPGLTLGKLEGDSRFCAPRGPCLISHFLAPHPGRGSPFSKAWL